MDKPSEEWRPVVGYEGLYEVSDQGRVRSLPQWIYRSDGGRRWTDGKILKPFSSPYGHVRVDLRANSVRTKVFVHILVLTAFVGSCPTGMQCRHLNGDPTNNHLANLKWGTPSENGFDRVRHGTDPQAGKTECKAGHPFDLTNTYYYHDGRWRGCKECRRETIRQQRKKAREGKWLNGFPFVAI